ncbi:MAG: Spy/CpxP family protein refolding chaperone [Thiotrichales bacterium]|nr:MAG: Spy/CpxP family protein refolding chaperone [Thiotrichales bacterium]
MKLAKRSIILVTGGALLVAGVVACNHGMYFGSAEERGEWMVEKVTRELELNRLQQDKLTAVKDEFLDLRRTMRSDREQTRTDVLAMLQQPTLDRDRANTIVAQYVDKVSARSPRIIDAVGNFYDSLDDEQREELTGFIEHKIEHHHRWHH